MIIIKKGDSLEKFVQFVYTNLLQLNDFKNVIVSTKVKIKGKSGAINEFDVYYEFKHLNFICKVVIECKDWKDPVSVKEVRDFHYKISDIGDCQIIGAMVSSSGYQNGSKEVASSAGIKLLTTDDLPSIATILASSVQKGLLPNADVEGEPFWTPMRLVENEVTGEYLDIAIDLELKKPTIPLFYSKYIAEKALSKHLDNGYTIRGVSKLQLKNLISFSPFGDTQFAIFYSPTFRGTQFPCSIHNADELAENYL